MQTLFFNCRSLYKPCIVIHCNQEVEYFWRLQIERQQLVERPLNARISICIQKCNVICHLLCARSLQSEAEAQKCAALTVLSNINYDVKADMHLQGDLRLNLNEGRLLVFFLAALTVSLLHA